MNPLTEAIIAIAAGVVSVLILIFVGKWVFKKVNEENSIESFEDYNN